MLFQKNFQTENLISHKQPLTTLTIFIKDQFADIKGLGIKMKLYAKYAMVKQIKGLIQTPN